LPAASAEALELLVAAAQNDDEATRAADVTLPCMAVYEQEGSLVNWYGRLQRIWPSVPAQRGDTAPGWLWVTRILEGLGFTHGVKSASAAFELLSGRSAELAELTLTRIPEQGVVLPRLLPAEWPQRAPRPQAPAHSRGPQTTPPGTKVGDEASGGSR
jgi:NADH dehydrogenase/NADH:ubiquinone oxidoreductase subunit G